MPKKNNIAVVAMSGGVDSSVAALLLRRQGYRVIGVTMKLWDFERVGGNINHESGCCSLESFNDARKICVSLGIPHYVLNFSREFHEAVVEDFIDEYLAGRTPNPCVQCNTKIKWKTLLEKVAELGADYIATGHYARVNFNESTKRYELSRGKDKKKDQSYALWGLRQDSLAKTLLPLGDYTKVEVRRLAHEFNLHTADKGESQEICFVPDNDYHRLLRSEQPGLEAKLKDGSIINKQGIVVGRHAGYPFYTVGQRRGLGGGHERPMYVVDIDASKNQITIGAKHDLFCREFIVENINLISVFEIVGPQKAKIKIRYNDSGHAGTIYPHQPGQLRIGFDRPQRAVTPGQSAVFFDGERVLGGAIIKQRLN
jgi:tRNA-specific 2-thiouridylase